VRRPWRTALIAALVTATATCGDGLQPVAGELTFALVTPNSGADGAVLLVVKGPAAITGVRLPSGSGLRLFASPPGADSITVALTGTLTNGVILLVGVADVHKATSYNAFVRQVAASDYTLRSLTGYGTTVSR
jgi:hypothetical protein